MSYMEQYHRFLGIGPDDIRLKELMQRLPADVEEIIIATNSSLEGETTASYIVKLIKTAGNQTKPYRFRSSCGGRYRKYR